MNLFARTELETTKQDAFSSEGKTFEQRTAMFIGLMEAVDAFRAHLTREERARRRRIAEQLDPRPDPWWQNIRKEALAEYQCQTEPDVQKEMQQLIEEYSRDAKLDPRA